MCGFDYFRDTLPVTACLVSSDQDVTTLSTDAMTVCCQVLNNGTKCFPQYVRRRLDAMENLHVEGDVDWIQQPIPVRLIV